MRLVESVRLAGSGRLGASLFAATCGAALALARCTSDDTSACDACIDVVPTALAVALTPAEVWVRAGDAPKISVALTRGPGGDGDAVITVATDGGMTADALTIPAASTAGALQLHIDAAVAQGGATLEIDATIGSLRAQASLIVHVAGASGTLDTSFGSGGVVDLSPSTGSDVAAAMIALQSGVLVGGTHVETNDASITSTMKVLRLTSGGGADTGFATTSAPGELASLAMLADGRIFAVGDVRNAKASFAAVRILAGGGLDPLYAVTTSLTLLDDVAFAGAIQPGGALVAAGSAGGQAAFGLTRYTQNPIIVDSGSDSAPDSASDSAADSASDSAADSASDSGTKPTSVLDPTFGAGGIVLTTFAQPNAGARALLVAPDGSLFAVGFARGSTTDVVAVRYAPNGAVDTTYGDAGGVGVPLVTGTFGAAVALLEPKGSIDVASDDNGQALVLRFLPSGALDTTFGSGGRAAITVGSASAARALARDPASGKLVATGFTGTPHRCFVARLSSSGVLDTSFAAEGALVVTSGDACDVAAVAIDDDGKILVLETVTQGSATHMAVARYWP